MLYKISGIASNNLEINPLEYKDFSHYGKLEKDLENLIANNLLDKIFENYKIMPIFQERKRQAEADIYALNEKGDLVIFELKRSSVNSDAVLQILRYSQIAGNWSYVDLQTKYNTYTKKKKDLIEAHKDAFNLEEPLLTTQFNNKQMLIVIGSAADIDLMNAVDYWKTTGVNINFIPYRIYEINKEVFFEFFALPYDYHSNITDRKGVIFDTNRTWDTNSIWYMFENNLVAAFGDAKRFINYLNPGDLIFYSHTGTGIIGVAKVKQGNILKDGNDTLYREVEFLTNKQIKNNSIKSIPFSQVSKILKKSFYWARTIKVPYLSIDEAEKLLNYIKTKI